MERKSYILENGQTVIKMPRGENVELLSEVWFNSTFRQNQLCVEEWAENKIALGEAAFLPLEEGEEYTISITERGVGIAARDRDCLMRGFMALAMRMIALEKDGGCCASLPVGEVRGRFGVGNRMIHLCLFPEHDFIFLRRLIRYYCALQYTHIVLEFWGMYRFSCFPELGWKDKAYSREQIGLLISEIRACGAQPVPFFNSLGHAPGARGCNGKHVVLDQEPSLAYLFTPDGWAWDITSETVFKRLKAVREELYELFGEGDYMMIGCDEADVYANGYRSEKEVADYFQRLTEEIVKEGRRPIIWGDMLLCKATFAVEGEKVFWSCNAKSEEQAEMYRNSLAKGTVIADWQYRYAAEKARDQETASSLKEKGFDVIACPFFDPNVIRATGKTVREYQLFGYMQTMWDRLHEQPWRAMEGAIQCGLPCELWMEYGEGFSMLSAAMWRKLKSGDQPYEHVGFNDVQFVKNTRQSI